MERDKRLIRQIKNKGSKEAANELISRYYIEIYTYVYKQTIDKELSMDLTQDIFVKMLKSLEGYDENKAAFRTWLYKIATYTLVDYFRSKYYKQRIMHRDIEEIDICDKEDMVLSLEYKQDVEKVVTIVNRLDALYQQIFRLKIFGGYTFLEISNMLKLPESTVKTKYYSMIKKIRKVYEE
ncbi:RNA polymerase sigma factor [Desnuesiella massiliensis]|uniref:RNA polymerase sigma factor n=1 Tax=Desnuesiella massiliensis TaxID=1650662 RepID=UPI0006E40191|nr:sigma-70 family RNA polymerase sigma factor [Desnuesiella massiliensis]